MSTYRKEWTCCGSVTETDSWEPERCPFCTADPALAAKDAEIERLMVALKSVLNHWREFGPEYGMDECVERSALVFAAIDAARGRDD